MGKRNQFLKLIILFCTLHLSSVGQNIYLGMNSEELLTLIQDKVYHHNKSDHYGRRPKSPIKFDLIYNDGKVVKAKMCYTNQYINDFKIVATLCRNHSITSGKLSHIETDYENISFSKLCELHEKSYPYSNYMQYYFDTNFKHYRTIKTLDNGINRVTYKETVLNHLPKAVQFKIPVLKKNVTDAEKSKEEKGLAQKREIEEIKSKIYNLNEYQGNYDELLHQQINTIQYRIKEKNLLPSWKEIIQKKGRVYRVKNTYRIHYQSSYSANEKDLGFQYYYWPEKDVYTYCKASIINGSDNTGEFFKQFLIRLPVQEINGVKVRTQVTFDSLRVDVIKGYCKIKIKKNGDVKYFKKNAPPEDIQMLMTEELKNEVYGYYRVPYQFVIINEKIYPQIELEKIIIY